MSASKQHASVALQRSDDTGQVIASRFSLLFSSLMRFFSCPEKVETLVTHLSGKSRASLRLIDWYITSYAKTSTVLVPLSQSRGNASMHTVAGFVNVYTSYRMQLRSFSKAFFDPFRRHNRMTIFMGNGQNVVTTIGQLNFFKWLIESSILDHIYTRIDSIEHDMRLSNANMSSRRCHAKKTYDVSSADADEEEEEGQEGRHSVVSDHKKESAFDISSSASAPKHGNLVLLRDANIRISF